MLPTTSFQRLYDLDACTGRYKYLAKALGGIQKYGKETPITLIQILDICGLEDLEWLISNLKNRPKGLAPLISSAYRRTLKSGDAIYDAAIDKNPYMSPRARDRVITAMNKAVKAEEKIQTARVREYLVKKEKEK